MDSTRILYVKRGINQPSRYGDIKNVVNKPGTDVSPLAKVVILLLFALPTAFISFLIISSAFDLSNFSTSEIIFCFSQLYLNHLKMIS